MTQYVAIVLAIENTVNFDVEFKSKIHGGKVVGLAKYDALATCWLGYNYQRISRNHHTKNRPALPIGWLSDFMQS